MKGNTRLKQDNITRVLEEIRDCAPVTKRELQEITGFSWGNISTTVNELQEKGYIVSVGKQETLVGRHSDQYDISPYENLIIGVDLNMNGILLVVTSLRGQAVFRKKRTYREHTYQNAIDTLYATVDEAVAMFGKQHIQRIAVGLQGRVDTKQGISVKISGLDYWENVPLVQMLEERYGIACMLIHDPDCVMRAEMNRGWLHKDAVDTALMLRLEKYAVGMSIIMNGQLRFGVHERAGEVGRVVLPYENELGWIFVDDLLPEAHMANNYKKMFPDTTEEMTYDLLWERVQKKDQRANYFLQKWVVALGMLLINMVNLFNPGHVILFGEMLQYQKMFGELLTELLKDSAYDNTVKLLFSKQNMDAAAIGAALWGADHWMRSVVF
ncbi:MAG: ROK family transcriptional regulator [Oscillospiraceae bacterium]|nr:ROK family transcriptional regulator [Oscillospiraceae bacterium]